MSRNAIRFFGGLALLVGLGFLGSESGDARGLRIGIFASLLWAIAGWLYSIRFVGKHLDRPQTWWLARRRRTWLRGTVGSAATLVLASGGFVLMSMTGHFSLSLVFLGPLGLAAVVLFVLSVGGRPSASGRG
jgi:hypothetical protein